MTLLTSFIQQEASMKSAAPQSGKAFRLTRTYVETGDERCPLAGIWSRLADTDLPTDDSELSRPVMGKLFPWRAFMRQSFLPGTLPC